MREYLRRIFTSPFDEHPDFRTFVGRVLMILNVGIFFLILVEVVFIQRRGALYTVMGLGAVLFVTQYALWTFRRGNILPTKLVLPLAAYAILTYVLILGNGMHDSALIGYAVVTTLSALLLGPTSMVYIGFLSLTSLGLVVLMDIKGLAGPPAFAQYTGLDDFLIGGGLTGLTIMVLSQVQNRLYQLLENLNAALAQQRKTTQELEAIKSSLEDLVQERTAALQDSLQNMAQLRAEEQRLARMYQSIAVLARRIAQTTVQTEAGVSLLHEITTLVSDTFGYYHVGIFLLDRNKAHAVLSAANSAGGQAMLEAHHMLPIRQDSVVGAAVVRGEPYVVTNTAEDSAHFKNPHLPDTQAEAAFPLFAGGEIIGVLDVQSTHIDAFDESAIEVLEILADEIAVAIYNAQLLENTQRQLGELQTIYREQARESWQNIARRLHIAGYRYRPGQLQPLENPLRGLANVPDQDQVQITRVPERNESRILAPIRLRGETLAVLEIRAPLEIAEREASEEVIQAMTERIALALENARLYEETTRRAQREHMVAQIANALRSTDNPDEMLQTAIRELKQALGAREVRIVSRD